MNRPADRCVCVVGSVNVDTTYRVTALPDSGETVLASGKMIAPGGKGANQAVAAAMMGSAVTFLGCTGEDAEGDLAVGLLAGRGVDVSQMRSVAGAATGSAVLIVDDHGENVIIVDPGANQRIDAAAIRRHLSNTPYQVILAQLEINLDAVAAAFESVPASTTVVLNPAPIGMVTTSLRSLLQHTDVLVPNRVELGQLAGRPTPVNVDAMDACVAALGYAGTVVVTLGRDGVALYPRADRPDRFLVDPVQVTPVDTTGAGDVFCGALAHGLAAGQDLGGAVRRANEVAALSTTFVGAQLAAVALSEGHRPPGTSAPVP